MQIAGIITEFNPFHNGHKYIIDKIREENDAVIAVMSGNYVQRGEPSIINKFSRAKAALKNGVDLIIELPSPWSASFAANFAYGAISLLKEANINTLYFGSESSNEEVLKKIAETDINLSLKNTKNKTFAKIREEAITSVLGNTAGEILSGSNDNLAIEYIKASFLQKCNFQIKAIKRIAVAHDSNQAKNEICSASLVRDCISDTAFLKEHLPPSSYELLLSHINSDYILDNEKFSTSVISYLRRLDDFSNLPDISEGIDMKLKKELLVSSSLQELMFNIKSKRYTLARIRRLILTAFLDIDNSFTLKEVPYMNVLGFTTSGEKILKDISKISKIPLIFSGKPSKPIDEQTKALLNSEHIRNDVYASLLKKPLPMGLDYTYGLIKP